MMRARPSTLAPLVVACALSPAPALSLDLNSFRAQNGRPPLSVSGALTGAAYSHAQSLAARQRLDHAGFRQRVSLTSGAAAENVAYGCATEDCVIRMWARSGTAPRQHVAAGCQELWHCLGGRRQRQALLGARTGKLEF